MVAPLSYICVGKIKSPHGLQGALCLLSYMEEPQALLSFSSFVDQKGNPFLTISQKLFEESPRVFVVKAEGISHRTMAEKLKEKELYLLKTQLPDLEKDVFYQADLLNLTVLQEDGTLLGQLRAVDNFGAGDLLEIVPQGAHRTPFWVPFRAPFVPKISLEKGYVCVSAQAIQEFGPSAQEESE